MVDPGHNNAATVTPQVTRHIARHISKLGFEDLPTDVVTISRHTLLDWLAVTLAGTQEPLAQMAATDAIEQGALPQATLIGRAERSSMALAALVNGATAHALDYDDTNFKAFGHVSAALIPALFALAETRNIGGQAFIVALVAGFEAAGRVGALLGEEHYNRGFHSSGTIGTFAAAGACANLIGLNAEQTAMAFGIAAAQAAGIKAMFGTMCKPLHAGKAAFNGLYATTMAERGFVSNPDALECVQGFAATHSPAMFADAAMASSSDDFCIRHNLFKFHASCYLTHAPAECARRLRAERGITPKDIVAARLKIEPTAFKTCDIPHPRTGLEGKFSVKQVVALALSGIDTGGLEAFAGTGIETADLARLRDMIDVEFTPQMARATAELELELPGGTRLVARHDAGQPISDLNLQEQKLFQKFMPLATPILGEQRAMDLQALVGRLEGLHSMQPIARLCQPEYSL